MLEALVIILALGGLELILWLADDRRQKKQVDLLEAIWTELALRNAAEESARSEKEPEKK